MPPCMSASIWTKWRLCIAIDAPCASVCEDLDCLLLQAKFIRATPLLAWLGLSRLVLAFVFAMIISAVSVLYKTSAVAILIWWPSFFSYFLVLCNQIRTGSRAEGRDRRGRGEAENVMCAACEMRIGIDILANGQRNALVSWWHTNTHTVKHTQTHTQTYLNILTQM